MQMGHLAVAIMRRMHERWHKEKLTIIDFNRVLDEVWIESKKNLADFALKFGLVVNVRT